MAKFIEIPVTSGTAHLAGKKLINVEDVSTAFCSAANAVKLFLGTGQNHVLLTTTAAKGIDVLNAINAAMTANPGGIKAKVQLASGIEITALAVA